MMNLTRTILSSFFGGAVILGIAAGSFAETTSMRVKDVSLSSPIFNPETNSYFQLFGLSGRGEEIRWPQANARAVRKFHEGERGRLAIVKDLKTLEFIREKFSPPAPIWIGVRYFCKYSRLLFVDGKLQSPRIPGMWHPRWHRTKVRCADQGYMPIYLTPPTYGGVFWQASGPKKVFSHFLVEYPAPAKSKNISQNSKETTVPVEADTAQ